MEDTTDFSMFERLKIASNAMTDVELAVNLKLTKQAIAQAKSKKAVPAAWVPKAAKLFNVSTDWLFFGRGPMRPDDMLPSSQESSKSIEPPLESCARCAKLEAKLDILEEERRELAAENRKLWKENGELKERCARLEPRQKQEEAHLFDEHRKISGSSDVVQSRL